MNKKKIAIFISSLSLGGITSFVIGIANYLASQGHSIKIYYTSALKEKLELLDESIECIKFKSNGKRSLKLLFTMLFKGYFLSALKIKFRDRSKASPISEIQKITRCRMLSTKGFSVDCDIAISSSEFFCNDFLAFKIKAPYKIGWIHPDLSKLNINKKILGECIEKLDKVVAVSEPCKNSLVSIFPEYKEKFVAIENILPQEMIRKMAEEPISDVVFSKDRLNIITVARIDNSSKRLDRIVRACRHFCDKGVLFHWYVVGEGSDLEMLRNLAIEYNVTKNLTFIGSKTNPYPYIRAADVFVLTSHYEGRPIAVDEALALHCPAVVTNYKSAMVQVPKDCGTIIANSDESISEELFSALFSNNIEKWKNNLQNYEFDNSISYDKINEIILF